MKRRKDPIEVIIVTFLFVILILLSFLLIREAAEGQEPPVSTTIVVYNKYKTTTRTTIQIGDVSIPMVDHDYFAMTQSMEYETDSATWRKIIIGKKHHVLVRDDWIVEVVE